MAENTGVEWATHTFNPWWVCTELSPACDNCYAKVLAARFGYEWGPDAPRRFFEEKHWLEPLRWDRKAKAAGERPRVFCASMSDVFELLPASHGDAERMAAAREQLWGLIKETPNLDWLLLTKRPQNILRLTPNSWHANWPVNAWAGTTAETQKFADQRIPHLLKVPAPVRFLSCEPLLGPIDLTEINLRPIRDDREAWTDALAGAEFVCDSQGEVDCEARRLDWVIVGGESGRNARPMHPDWARSLRDQCQVAGVPFHFKQWGEWAPGYRDDIREYPSVTMGPDGAVSDSEASAEILEFCRTHSRALPLYRAGTKIAGRTLQGREWSEFPAPGEAVPA